MTALILVTDGCGCIGSHIGTEYPPTYGKVPVVRRLIVKKLE